MSDLPPELWVMIGSYLQGSDYLSLRCVSRLHANYLRDVYDALLVMVQKISGDCVSVFLVEYGKIDLIQWASDNNKVIFDLHDLDNAAMWGRLDILQYLHQKGYPLTEMTFCLAACYDQLEVLEYLHQHRCPYSRYVFYQAAFYGHVRIYQWFHQHRYPGDPHALHNARSAEHFELADWLVRHGY